MRQIRFLPTGMKPFLWLLAMGFGFNIQVDAEIRLGGPTTLSPAGIGAAAPQGLAYHPQRNSIYILDANGKMTEVGLAGNVIQSFNLGLMAPGGGVSYDPETGQLLVANGLRVLRVDVDGSSVAELVDLDGDVFASEGIAVDSQTGNIWVADDDNEEIVQVDRTGAFISSFSTRNLAPGFIEPAGLSFLGKDLLIADDREGTHSLYRVSTTGKLIQVVGDMSNFGVSDPEGVTSVGNSQVWVCGDADNKIVVLNRLDSAQEPSLTSSFYFPQVGDGRAADIRFQTSLILISKGKPVTARIEFFDSAGSPLALELGDLGIANSFNIDLEAGQAVSLQTPGTGMLRVGYAKVSSEAEIGGTAVFTRSDFSSGTILYEAGVPASQPQASFSLFVDSTGHRDTGLALVNPRGGQGTESDARVTLRLFDTNSNQLDEKVITLLPGEHLARYVFQLFPNLPRADEMKGVLVVSSDRPLAAITLRQNDNPDLDYPNEVPTLTTFPVIAFPSSSLQVER